MRLLRSSLLIVLFQCNLFVEVLGTTGAETPNVPFWGLQTHTDPTSLHIRRQDGLITPTHSTSNTTLTAAQKLVKAAQAEALIRNTYLIEHPRRNIYEFRSHPVPNTVDNGTATGVNSAVAHA